MAALFLPGIVLLLWVAPAHGWIEGASYEELTWDVNHWQGGTQWTQIHATYTHTDAYNAVRAWKAPRPRYKTGALAKYARLVSSASEGAVTS